jgi:hypothetical protein
MSRETRGAPDRMLASHAQFFSPKLKTLAAAFATVSAIMMSACALADDVEPKALPDRIEDVPATRPDPFPAFDNFSWRAFIALARPAQTDAAQRGEPDRSKTLGDSGPRVQTSRRRSWPRFDVYRRLSRHEMKRNFWGFRRVRLRHLGETEHLGFGAPPAVLCIVGFEVMLAHEQFNLVSPMVMFGETAFFVIIRVRSIVYLVPLKNKIGRLTGIRPDIPPPRRSKIIVIRICEHHMYRRTKLVADCDIGFCDPAEQKKSQDRPRNRFKRIYWRSRHSALLYMDSRTSDTWGTRGAPAFASGGRQGLMPARRIRSNMLLSPGSNL